jgi:hypothetical protein
VWYLQMRPYLCLRKANDLAGYPTETRANAFRTRLRENLHADAYTNRRQPSSADKLRQWLNHSAIAKPPHRLIEGSNAWQDYSGCYSQICRGRRDDKWHIERLVNVSERSDVTQTVIDNDYHLIIAR